MEIRAEDITRIIREEFGKGPKKTAEVPTLPTTTLPTAEELDADGDGAISDAEYTAKRQQIIAEL